MNAHVGISFETGGSMPPSSVEAEQALLGGLLANNKAYDYIAGILAPEHFADPVHARIYKSISDMIEAGMLADGVTVAARFGDKVLSEVGGSEYIAKLCTAMVSIVSVPDYAKAIRDTWIRRQQIDIYTSAATRAYETSPDASGSDLLDEVSGALSDLAVHSNNASAGVSLGDAIGFLEEEAMEAASGNVTRSVSCGIPSIDKCMLRLRSGRLYIIGGRPGMGKSALAKTWAVNVALGRRATLDGTYHSDPKFAWGVGYTAMEESKEDLAGGIMSDLAGIAANDISNGIYLSDNKLAEAFVRAKRDLRLAMENIVIYDKPGQTMRQIAHQARALHRKMKGRLKLYIVDYVQLMGAPAGSKDRRLAVTDDIQGLKNLARELDICVVALSQLKREIDDRPNPRPTLNDLKETGAFEEIGDVIIYPFREAYYHLRKKPVRTTGESDDYYGQRIQEWQVEQDILSPKSEMDFPKVKRGRGGVFCTPVFNPIRTRFEELPQL